MLGYAGNEKVQTEVNGMSNALGTSVLFVIGKAESIAKLGADAGITIPQIASMDGQLTLVKAQSQTAQGNVKKAENWRFDTFNFALISAMGLVLIGLLGSICNMSTLAMTMCILAWVAVVVAWLCFGIHLGISVFLDDTCYLSDNYLQSDLKEMEGLNHLFKCPDATSFQDAFNTAQSASDKTRSAVNDASTGLPSLGIATLPAQTYVDPVRGSWVQQNKTYNAFNATCGARLIELQKISEDILQTSLKRQQADALIIMINGLGASAQVNLHISFFSSCYFFRYFIGMLYDHTCGDLMSGFRMVYASFGVIGILMICVVLLGSKMSNRFDSENWEENVGKSEDKAQEGQGLLDDKNDIAETKEEHMDPTESEPNVLSKQESPQDADAEPISKDEPAQKETV